MVATRTIHSVVHRVANQVAQWKAMSMDIANLIAPQTRGWENRCLADQLVVDMSMSHARLRVYSRAKLDM